MIWCIIRTVSIVDLVIRKNPPTVIAGDMVAICDTNKLTCGDGNHEI